MRRLNTDEHRLNRSTTKVKQGQMRNAGILRFAQNGNGYCGMTKIVRE
jgi:hypothetical protein